MRTKNINTIRGFAALIVFVMHFFTIPQSTKISTGLLSNVEQGVYAVIMAGYSGVGLFIFLSGYLLTQSKLKYNENFRTYLLWRFLRIYPVYLIILILSIIASRQWDWHGFLNALFLLPNLPGTLWPFPWLATAWSLGVEWTLYFSLFFLVYVNLLHKKNIMALQLLFFGLMILAGTQGTDKHTIVSGSLLGRSVQFSLGVLFAITLKNYKIFQGISRRKLVLFSGLIYLSWAVISWRAGGVSSNGSWRLIQPYAESFICACLILCAEKEQRRLNIFTRGMSFLGKVSYPFYLIHVTVLVSLDGLILKTKFLELETHIYAIVFFTSTLSVAVLISTFFHFGIEEPIDNLKASRRQKSKF